MTALLAYLWQHAVETVVIAATLLYVLTPLQRGSYKGRPTERS